MGSGGVARRSGGRLVCPAERLAAAGTDCTGLVDRSWRQRRQSDWRGAGLAGPGVITGLAATILNQPDSTILEREKLAQLVGDGRIVGGSSVAQLAVLQLNASAAWPSGR